MKRYILILSNESETLLLGSKLAKICVTGCIIYLIGFIGTGKSVLCTGFLRALGYTSSIKSPTYTLIESYFLSNKCVIHHFDFYRLNSEKELIYMGIRDYFDGQSICLIEWPDRGMSVLPTPDITITIDYDHKESRKVILESFKELGELL